MNAVEKVMEILDVKFTTLWEEFSVPLKSFIKKRITNEQDTEDILQEVFSKIHSNMGGLKDDNKIHAWVYWIFLSHRTTDTQLDTTDTQQWYRLSSIHNSHNNTTNISINTTFLYNQYLEAYASKYFRKEANNYGQQN